MSSVTRASEEGGEPGMSSILSLSAFYPDEGRDLPMEEGVAASRTVLARFDAILDARLASDELFCVLQEPGGKRRREYIAAIQGIYETEFAAHLDPGEDPELAAAFSAFFTRDLWRGDRHGHWLQSSTILTAIALCAPVSGYLCPPAPDPDSSDPDGARVDRTAYGLWRQTALLPAMDNLLNGARLTLPGFCTELIVAYARLLPPAP